MAKVDLSAAVTADAGVTANAIPQAQASPRYNLYSEGEYLTTVRAETFEEACAIGAKDNPGKTFTGPPADKQKLKKKGDSPRKNLFVIKNGQLEYFTTEIAATHAEAKAQAQAKHPGAELLSEDDF